MKIVSYPSPNFNERPIGCQPDMIILHHTNMTPVEEALERLTDPASQVSCHYLIRQTGEIDGLVPEEKRAWHAGVSSWKDRSNINDYSIGIELDSLGDVFPTNLMESLVWLIRDIRSRYQIPDAFILGHSDIAPLRKDDPSAAFDWEFLHTQGIGIMPEKSNTLDRIPLLSSLQQSLKNIGYSIEITGQLDHQTTEVTKAFQRHFRRWKVDGIFDKQTASYIKALASQA